MHRVNAGFTLLARLDADRVDAATALLAELDKDPARLPFARSATTHFATITIIPAQRYQDELLPATLMFATSYCGPTGEHVSELVAIMGAGMRGLFAHCVDFDVECSDDELEDFMRAHRQSDTFYSGMQDLSPEDVRRHCELRDAIETYIDERQATGGLTGTASDVRREIQEHVRSRPELAWAREPWKPTLWSWVVLKWRSLLIEAFVGSLIVGAIARCYVDNTALDVFVIGGGIALGAFLLFVLVLLVQMREAEAAQTFVSSRHSDEYMRRLAATQTRPVINEFTLAGPIKPEGSIRPLFLRLSLWLIARGVEGVPGIPYLRDGINIPTVATARWIAADDGRRAIFISNYTNDGVGYVRDFIETPAGAMRINLTFGFGTGFPKTEWVILEGALTEPNAYLHALAENQMPTMFWYGPYRNISIDNIKHNRKIREGLFADYNEKQARDWLLLL